jgi:hypothetical protein
MGLIGPAFVVSNEIQYRRNNAHGIRTENNESVASDVSGLSLISSPSPARRFISFRQSTRLANPSALGWEFDND